MRMKNKYIILVISFFCISRIYGAAVEQAYFDLAQAFRAEGNIDQAIECYKKVLERNRQNPDALYNLALELYQKGATHEAIAYFEQRLAITPNHFDSTL